MKVIHLCLGKANPERMNGVNKVVDALANEQAKQGIDVEVWGITQTPNDPTPKRSYSLKLFQGKGRSFAMPAGMAKAMDALPKDTIFHIHGVMTPVFYTITRALKKRNLQWVLAPHGAYNAVSMHHRAWLKYPFVLVFDRFILRHAKALHIGTVPELDTVRWICPQTPIALIKNGQNLDEYKDFKSTDIAKPQRPVFGFVGRLSIQHKGLDILIRGFTSYVNQGGKGVLWLIGDGPDHNAVEKMAESIKNRVVFYGPQFGDDKLNLVSAMDVFVHTSRWEVMPMAILEAAAMSRTLLLSKPTNLTDWVKQWDAGFVLEENTPSNLYKTMLDIDNNVDQLAIKGQNARAMVAADFTWQAIAHNLMNEAYQ